MTENAYKNAMKQVKFSEQQSERIASLMIKQVKVTQRRRKHVFYGAGIAACVVLGIIAIVFGSQTNQQLVMVKPSLSSTPSAAVSEQPSATSAEAPVVVVSSDYNGGLTDSYVSPKMGQAIITEEVRKAFVDEKNENALFFVNIQVVPQELNNYNYDMYMYNGRSLSEWSELADLSRHEYPYDEYNGDHGGNITKNQWEQAQQQAKALEAQKNYDTGVQSYNAEIIPLLDEARISCEESELVRLQQVGYDVFFMETWSYIGAGEKQNERVLAGLLTREQVTDFVTNRDCGYLIEWVRNGDGVIDWEEGLRN